MQISRAVQMLDVVDSALLIAYGKRSSASAWRECKNVRSRGSWAALRGLHGLRMIPSDNHPGLKNARKSVFPSVPWQRCQFHLQQNASAHVPEKSMQGEVHDDIRNIFNMPSKEKAESLPKRTIDGSLNARRKLRATKMVEFQNKELKKRTGCISVFPNRESLLRIASALLSKLDDFWLAEVKVYIAG